MKRYTVKEVVRLENQTEQLTNIRKQRLDRLYSLPLSMLTAMGVVLTMGAFKEGMVTTLPLILGATATLSGGTSLAYLFSAKQIRGKLREKLNKIYDIMGEDFKKDVKEEQRRQKYDFLDDGEVAYDPAFDLYSDEEIERIFGGKQR
ncbi:MAG: hypothetical protein J6B98_05335 [Bacilli bacterium]|nr:hypothetical protein [Bacilli bacterium]